MCFQDIFDELFAKKYTLKSSETKSDPSELKIFSKIGEKPEEKRPEIGEISDKFAQLKHTLNEAKAKLSDKDIHKWHDFTAATHPAGRLIQELKRKINPELGTQAFCKFYDVLVTFPGLVEKVGNSNFRSLHLCEAPGAFISALNHYLKSKDPSNDFNWEWYGSTLNPYFEGNASVEMISDDRLIRSTVDRWIFGSDNNGDITKRSTFAQLKELASKLGRFNLVTADGSIDCQNKPAEQEALTFPLHFCETISVLTCLTPGGSFVIKKFTCFEAKNWSLIYFLKEFCFETVTFYKPPSSKVGNSEVYVVCERFKGLNDSILEEMCKNYETSEALTLTGQISVDFLENLYEISEKLAQCQLKMIEFNLDFFEQRSLPEKYGTKQRETAEKILKKWKIERIMPEQRLMTRFVNAPWSRGQLPWRRREGTYEDRTEEGKKKATVLKQAKNGLGMYSNERFMHGSQFGLYCESSECARKLLDRCFSDEKMEFTESIIFGRSLVESGIRSSKFCTSDIMDLYHNLRTEFEPNSNHLESCELSMLEPFISEENYCNSIPNGDEINFLGGPNSPKKRKLDSDLNTSPKIEIGLRENWSEGNMQLKWIELLIDLIDKLDKEDIKFGIVIEKPGHLTLLTRLSANLAALFSAMFRDVVTLMSYSTQKAKHGSLNNTKLWSEKSYWELSDFNNRNLVLLAKQRIEKYEMQIL